VELTMADQQPRFVASLDTQTICRRLREAGEGEVVTYEELQKLIGRDPRKHGARTAVGQLLRDGIVFKAIDNVGYKRLSDSEKVKYGAAGIGSINRKARKTMRVLGSAQYDRLNAEDKLKHNTSMTLAAMAAASTAHDAMKRIERSVASSDAAIPAARAALVAIAGIEEPKK
jgi:hypothetical protein